MRALVYIWIVLTTFAIAETDYVHPRVHELEDKLGQDVNVFLKGRFPDLPFLVTVKIDPIYRTERSYDALAKGERLPYFDLDTEEIRDEWDDPEKTLSELSRRIRKAAVTISIPNSVSDSEIAEIRDSLFSLLHLNSARDEITVQRRDWQTAHFNWRTTLVISVALMIALLGLLLINRSSANRIAKAVIESRSSGGGGAAIVAPAAAPTPSRTRATSAKQTVDGNVKVNDPLRLKDVVGRIVDGLVRGKAFPNRYDIFELDEFGMHNPAGLGALLVELPLDKRQAIFAYGSGDWWLDALAHPGMLDFEALEVLQRLSRNPRDESSTAWDHLVLSVWRLGDKCAAFIKSLPREEGFAILYAMPKAAALIAARQAFPGNWAAILRSDTEPHSLDDNRIVELQARAVQQRPLSQMSQLDTYRQEIELLVHLKIADPYEEKEIYDALPDDSKIRSARPAFFRLFDQSEQVVKQLLTSLTTEQWAMVLLDVRPQERLKIESVFSDKQKFLYQEKQKTLLLQNFKDPDLVGDLREQVARRVPAIVREIETKEKFAKEEAEKFERKMKQRKGEIDEENTDAPTRNAA